MHYPALVVIGSHKNLPVVGDSNLHRYLNEIGQYHILGSEESNELAIRFVDYGDQDAAKQLVIANLRLVVKIALEYRKYWQSNFLDLIQEGNSGLARAVKTFDPYRGVKFSSYASYWVKAYILKCIMDNWRLVKIGTTQTMRRMFFNFYKEKKQLEVHGSKVNDDTLAKRLHVKKEQLAGISERLSGADISLYVPVSDESSSSLQDMIADAALGVEETVARKELHSKFHAILEKEKCNLSPRENLILFRRLLSESPLTLREIGNKWNISRERVRQIEVRLLKHLKEVFFRELGGDLSWV